MEAIFLKKDAFTETICPKRWTLDVFYDSPLAKVFQCALWATATGPLETGGGGGGPPDM